MIEKRGVVSVWIGALRSKKHLDRYLEELYFDDEAHASVFAREFDLDAWDDYALEARYAQRARVADLLVPLSHSASFKEPATTLAERHGWSTATTVIVLYDLAFIPEEAHMRSKQSVTFVGTFPYDPKK